MKIWKHTKQLTSAETGHWIKIKVTSVEKALSYVKNYRKFFHFSVICKIQTRLSPHAIDRFYDLTPIRSFGSEPSLILYIEDQRSSLSFVDLMDQNKKVTKDQRLVNATSQIRLGRNWNTEKPCHLEDFFLDFHRIGWVQVIHPPKLNIYQCAGKCLFPFPAEFETTANAIMRGVWQRKCVFLIDGWVDFERQKGKILIQPPTNLCNFDSVHSHFKKRYHIQTLFSKTSKAVLLHSVKVFPAAITKTFSGRVGNICDIRSAPEVGHGFLVRVSELCRQNVILHLSDIAEHGPNKTQTFSSL
eukprot:sb/3467338/